MIVVVGRRRADQVEDDDCGEVVRSCEEVSCYLADAHTNVLT